MIKFIQIGKKLGIGEKLGMFLKKTNVYMFPEYSFYRQKTDFVINGDIKIMILILVKFVGGNTNKPSGEREQ